MKILKSFTTIALLSLLAGGVFAQDQPEQATNAQDEEVNIELAPNGGGESTLLIMRTPDTNAANDYYSKVYELGVEGWEILPFLDDIVVQEGGSVNFWNYYDEQEGRWRYFVQAVTAPYQYEFIDALVREFNRPGAVSRRGGMRRHLRVKHRLASDLAGVLNRGVISGDGFVEFDNETNTIFVRDSTSDGQRALEVLRYYDVPPRMVEMKVRIVEVDVSDSAQLGLDWDAWKTSLSGFLQFSSAERSDLSGDFTSFDSLLNLDATVLAEFLNYLVNEGSASVVTNTTLTAINGQTAVLESMRRIPNLRFVREPAILKNVDDARTGDDEDEDELIIEEGGQRSVLTDVGVQSEGFFITIFPRIGTQTMVAEVNAVVSSLVAQNALDEPILASRRVETIINLLDREPVLVGAFDKTTTLEVQDGIPGLRSIPWVGSRLFAETTNELRHSKLVVLMTPRIDDHLMYTAEEIEYGERMPAAHYPPYSNRPAYGPEAPYLNVSRTADESIERVMPGAQIEETGMRE